MTSNASRTSKPTKPPNNSTSSPAYPSSSSSSSRSSFSSHLAMVELKQRILNSLSKLSDRDTYQIAVEDLEKIIQTLSPEGIPMLLNCLYDALNDPKAAVKKESLRLLTMVCASHVDSTSTHLTKIIAHIVKRLKDSDSALKDACRDTIGALSAQYLKGEGGGDNGSVVALFVKSLFDAMGEQNNGVQSGAAMCMAKMVDCAPDPPITAFQKLCPRICKLLNNHHFLAKAALFPVISSLSQVGAITPQCLDQLLPSIHECLGSTDWVTRKAAADALIALALNTSSFSTDGAASTLAALEACRFDKIKPVRDSMTEALQLWKKIAGKEDVGTLDEQEVSSRDVTSEKNELRHLKLSERIESSTKESSNNSSPTSDFATKAKVGSISGKAVMLLKKKAPPGLSDKELNPEFFQNLEIKGSGDLPVEVVVPRRYLGSSSSNNEEEAQPNDKDSKERSSHISNQSDDSNGMFSSKYRDLDRGTAGSYSKQRDHELEQDICVEEKIDGRDSRTESINVHDRINMNKRDTSSNNAGFSRIDGQSEGSFINNKGNWFSIQRQLLQLERQQAHLMNMLRDFMGGSHDSMVTLENRVIGLERVVDDMARDLSISSGRKGGNFAMGFEGSSNRPLGRKYNSFPDYAGTKFGRSADARGPFPERFAQTDGISPSMRRRGSHWRSDMSEVWDFPTYGVSRNGHLGPRKAQAGGSMDGRSPKSENDSEQGSRGWDKGAGPFRFGEGPSARSVWQASKDEATLEAIRVAGDDNGTSRTTRVAIPELTAEASGDDNAGQDRDPVWTSWINAMDALQVGDMDSAYAEVLSTGDDLLLVKLMDRSGPVVGQLSNEIAYEVIQAVINFLSEQNLFDICLSWIQQLTEVVLEHGPNFLSLPMELKKELLLNLNEACKAMEQHEEWEGAMPDQLLMQLASSWGVDLQQHHK